MQTINWILSKLIGVQTVTYWDSQIYVAVIEWIFEFFLININLFNIYLSGTFKMFYRRLKHVKLAVLCEYSY